MQSRRHSLEEVVVGTLVGLIVSTILNQTVLPMILGVHMSAGSNVLITVIYTAASIARGHFLRRHYNRKVVQKWNS